MKEMCSLSYQDLKKESQILYKKDSRVNYTIKKKSNKIYLIKRSDNKVVFHKEYRENQLEELYILLLSNELTYKQEIKDYKR